MGGDSDAETSPAGFVDSARKDEGQPGGSQSGPTLEGVPDIRGKGFGGRPATTSSWGFIGWAGPLATRTSTLYFNGLKGYTGHQVEFLNFLCLLHHKDSMTALDTISGSFATSIIDSIIGFAL